MKITQTIGILLSLFLGTATMHAAPIDAQRARNAAQNFAAQKGKHLSVASEPMKAKASAVGTTPYYIYNVEGDGGFIIVAGDDRVPTILGYTDSGRYDAAALPDGLRALLADYATQMAQIDSLAPDSAQMAMPKRAASVQVAIPSRHYVAPLLPTLWNQKTPYNAQCPIYNKSDGTSSGVRSATGCVATALGQMMALYRYPAATKKDIPSYSFSSGGKSIKMDAIAKGTTIDWAHIKDTYGGSYTTAEADAIARLMVIVGTSCNMVYGAASGSNMQSGVQMLREVMGYDESVRNVCRTSYTQAEWVALLYNEVAEGRPVGYRANSAVSGGHAFVIDGYDTDDLFHVNWGWGGASNGFFRISVLYQSEATSLSTANGRGFSIDQEAIIGVKPSDGVTTGGSTAITLSGRGMSVSGNTITLTFTNFTGASMNGYVGVGVISADGSIDDLASNMTLLSNNYEITKTFTISSLPAGTHRIVPIFRKFGESQWQVCTDPDREYVSALSAGGKITLTLYPQDTSKLSVKTWSFVNNRVAGVAQHIKVTIGNTGGDYAGPLYLFASTNASSPGAAVNSGGVSLVGGMDSQVTFFFTPQSAGTYYLWLARDAKASQVVGTSQVVIAATDPKALDLSVAYVAYDNMVSNKVYGNYRHATITISNKGTADYDGNLVVSLYCGAVGSTSLSPVTSQIVALKVKAGEQGRTTCRFNGLSDNYKYAFRIFYEGGQSALDNNNPYVIYSREQHAGVVYYAADGTTRASLPASSVDAADAMAVDMRGVTGITAVSPSTNPNALYLFDAAATVPTSLEELNVVRGTTAKSITLKDGYAFGVPATFTATSIRYTRTLAADAQSENNWQTLSLPFAPTSISRGGTAVNIDQRQLLVRRFAGQDQSGQPVFESVSVLSAQEPYVIKGEGLLRGAEITFEASGAQVSATTVCQSQTDDYRFLGSLYAREVSGAYLLNTHSNALDRHAEAAEVQPFRAYMMTTQPSTAPQASIVIEGTASGITMPTTAAGMATIYTLQGIKVGTVKTTDGTIQTSSLAPGVYIVNGRKVVKQR